MSCRYSCCQRRACFALFFEHCSTLFDGWTSTVCVELRRMGSGVARAGAGRCISLAVLGLPCCSHLLC